jgi:hypothetical protein
MIVYTQARAAAVHQLVEHGVRIHPRRPAPLQPPHLGRQQGASCRGGAPGTKSAACGMLFGKMVAFRVQNTAEF